MRKLLLGIIILFVVGLLAWLSFSIIQKAEEKEKLEAGAPLPSFSFEQLDGHAFRNSDLEPGQPLVFKYFNPECDHCQSETRELVQQIDLFKPDQIIMISPAVKDEVVDFKEAFELEKYPQIILLLDKDLVFDDLFGEAHFPCTYVYDAQHELIEFIRGEVKTTYIHRLTEQ